MALTPGQVKAAFQNEIPLRRRDFARRKSKLRSEIQHEILYEELYPSRVLEMAETELRDRIDLAAERVRQLIDSGWLPDELTTLSKVFLDMFGGYDTLDKDPQSDLYRAVESAVEEFGRHDSQQQVINPRRISQMQVDAATSALSNLEVYFGVKYPTAPHLAPETYEEKAAVVRTASRQWEYDAFISHASEDKPFVRELADRLRKLGVNVWFDEFTLTVGDSLREQIDSGLKSSRYGIVVLSPNFFNKPWPQLELDGLVTLQNQMGEKVILPVWHDIDAAEVAARSPLLAGRLAVRSTSGMNKVVADLAQVLRPEQFANQDTPEPQDGATTFRSQIIEFIRDGRSLILKFGPKPSDEQVAELIIDYGKTLNPRYLAIKHHLESLLGFAQVKPLATLPLPMSPGAISRTLDALEKLTSLVAPDLPAYPPELDGMG